MPSTELRRWAVDRPMRFPRYLAWRHAAMAAGALVLLAATGCQKGEEQAEREALEMTRRPITEVLARHTGELMAIEGVAIVYQGMLPDGTDCIKVGVVEKTRAIEREIPDELEGYPVVIVESGEIGPVDG